MAVLPILTVPDAVLTRRAAPVEGVGSTLRQLAADMLDTMYAAPGRGLAAPQVGVLRRMFVMDVSWKEGVFAPRVIVNPELVWLSEVVATGPEVCLSIPGVVASVPRASAVTMVWTDLDGSARLETLTGMEAICAQHEYDHLDGVLTLDRLSEADRALAMAEGS